MEVQGIKLTCVIVQTKRITYIYNTSCSRDLSVLLTANPMTLFGLVQILLPSRPMRPIFKYLSVDREGRNRKTLILTKIKLNAKNQMI